MWTKGNGVQAADSALAAYRAQLTELEAESNAISSDQNVVGQQFGDALGEAAATVLPDASPPTLERAAKELVMPWLANRRRELEAQRSQWQQRLAAIEVDTHFLQRERLLHPTQGTLAHQRQETEALLAQLESHLGRFDTETFNWLQSRELGRQMQQGGFSSFWDAVTFGGYREDKAKQRCAKELGYPSYTELQQDYDGTQGRIAQARQYIAALDEQRKYVLGLLDEHGKLYGWIHHFEVNLTQALRSELARAMAAQDLRTVAMRIRPEAKKAVARAHALQKKNEYLGNVAGFIGGQLADRSQRAQAIAACRSRWAMKPWERLSGDKSKWLLALPAMKRDSTHKQVRWSRRIHKNIIEYEDYDDYAYYLGNVDDFLAYDAFAWGAEEPMPYEGFSRAIIGELGRHRYEHQQARADYAMFRQADRQSEREDSLQIEHRVPQEALGSEEDAIAAAALSADERAVDVTDAS